MNTKTSRHSRSGSASGQRRSFSSSTSRNSRFSNNRPNRYGGGSSFSGRRNRGPKKMPTFDPSQFINKTPVDLVEEVYEPKNMFNTMGLNHRLVGIITKMGLKIPTPIQDQIIPEILQGNDVIGLAETGTGKTAAFLIPLIEKALKNPKREVLILAPTRELAIQIGDELRKLSQGLKIYSAICVGGMSIQPQIKALRYKNQFVIGTPGRVMDLINRRFIRPQNMKAVVLDEADRMLDMGFIGDMRSILSATPENRETLFFSATMSAEAKKLVNDFLKNPVEISVKKKDVTSNIEQDVVQYEHHNKFDTLLKLLSQPEFKRVLIFGAMKHSVEKLAQELSKAGIRSESIHGNKSHGQRQRALLKFKRGMVRVLVATDVAARGIHVESVSHVINYDLPNTFEDYVHRIGRTGRADKRGKALTFVSKFTPKTPTRSTYRR